jgi:hypothetical protein
MMTVGTERHAQRRRCLGEADRCGVILRGLLGFACARARSRSISSRRRTRTNPPWNLVFALSMQPLKFGSAGCPGVSPLCSHLSSELAVFETHLFLPTRHVVCGLAATFVTAAATTRTPPAITLDFNCFIFCTGAMSRSPRRISYACCPAGGTQQFGVPSSAWVPIGPGFSGTILPPTSTPSLHLAPVSCGRFPCAAGDPPWSSADRGDEGGIRPSPLAALCPASLLARRRSVTGFSRAGEIRAGAMRRPGGSRASLDTRARQE